MALEGQRSSQIALTAFAVLAAAIWTTALCGGASASTRLSNAGQAVGFVAGISSVYALLVALRQLSLQQLSVNQQAREQAHVDQRRHSDEERAHMDRLAIAYTTWFEKVLPVITTMRDTITTAWTRGGAAESRLAVNLMYGYERILRTAAIPLLMFERRKEVRIRVESILAQLPTWEGPLQQADLTRFETFVADMSGIVVQRHADIEQLFSDVAMAMYPSEYPQQHLQPDEVAVA